jgi:hypothetical protein
MAITYILHVAFILAHLAGLVVAIILLVKHKGTAAILATVAFALLFIQDIGAVARLAFLDDLIFRQAAANTVRWVVGGFNCCCGFLDLAAIVCLIIAVWQAVSGAAPKQEGGTPSSFV